MFELVTQVLPANGLFVLTTMAATAAMLLPVALKLAPAAAKRPEAHGPRRRG